jgi:hypothetical protein
MGSTNLLQPILLKIAFRLPTDEEDLTEEEYDVLE